MSRKNIATITLLTLCFSLPLVFTTATEELFEFPKMLLVYAGAITLSGLVVADWIKHGSIRIPKTPLDLPILFFFLSQVFSTVFSIDTRTSLFGYYSRFHGGLLSTVSYAVIFYAAIYFFEKKDRSIFLTSTLLGGIVAALYAFPEHFGVSPSCILVTGSADVACWVQDVQNRVFGTIGQPNWLAAYLLVLAPYTLLQAIDSLRTKKWGRAVLWHAVLSLFVAVIFFTKSRSGILGLGVASIFFALVQSVRAFAHAKDRGQFAIYLPALCIGCVLFLRIPNPMSDRLNQLIARPVSVIATPTTTVVPLGTQLDSGGSESGDIRKVVWQGALGVWRRYPVFGSGVETFALAYYKDRPAAHNLLSEWDYLYNKAHNEFLNFLATTGTVGFLAYLTLYTALIALPLLRFFHDADEFGLATASALIGLAVSNFFGFSTVGVGFLTLLLPALTLLSYPKQVRVQRIGLIHTSTEARQFSFFLTALCFGALLVGVYRMYASDVAYASGKRLLSQSQIQAGIASLQQAMDIAPENAVYRDEYAYTLARISQALAQTGESTSAGVFAQEAVKESDYVISKHGQNVNFFKTRARIYTLLGQIDPIFFKEAAAVLSVARELSPTDPKLPYNLALLARIEGNSADEEKYLRETIQLRPIDLAARGDLALLSERLGKKDSALEQYHEILRQDPTNPLASTRSASLSGIIQE